MNKVVSLFCDFWRMRSVAYLSKRFGELVFGYPLYLLSFLCIRDKNKWCFGTNVGFVDNAKYMFIYTNEYNDNIRAVWISSNKQDVLRIRDLGFEAYRKYSLKGLYHSLTAHVYIFTYHSKDVNFFTSGNVKKVNLWHGVGIKGGNGGRKSNNFASGKNTFFLTKIFLPHLYEKNDLFLSTSDMMDVHFSKMFSLEENVVFNSIYPRCYYMCKKAEEIIHFIRKYESVQMLDTVAYLSTFDKVFLYMPTWRGNLNDDFISAAGFDFDILNERLCQKKRLFILKLHPAVRNIKNNADKKYTNILFLDKQLDIYPLLPFVDCLITDYSSIYYDFLLLNKEVLLYPFDKNTFLEYSNDLAFDYEEYTPGERVFSITELEDRVISDKRYWVKDANRIIQAFWGKSDVSDLNTLYNKIKAL